MPMLKPYQDQIADGVITLMKDLPGDASVTRKVYWGMILGTVGGGETFVVYGLPRFFFETHQRVVE